MSASISQMGDSQSFSHDFRPQFPPGIQPRDNSSSEKITTSASFAGC